MRHIDNAHRSDCHRYISSLVGGEKQGWEYLIRATNRTFGDLRRGEMLVRHILSIKGYYSMIFLELY